MAETKEVLDSKIRTMLKADSPNGVISRRLFLYDFCYAFDGYKERGFSILNEICDHFNVTFSSVKTVGSAHLGYSYFSKRPFNPRDSDLDVAIINAQLFQQYSELVYKITKGYSDQSKFRRISGINAVGQFRDQLSAGYFRPDLMPNSDAKDLWFRFFNQLSNKHADLFNGINAGIYMSEGFFEMKNASVVARFKKEAKND